MTRNHPHTAWLAVLAMTALLLLSTIPVSAQGNGNGDDDGGDANPGTIKVHDEVDADPDKRNEPHVDCEDFWVEGFNMAVDSGDLTFLGWPPTGDKTVVLEAEWTADDAEPEFHFLAGPFTLPAGHYRVEASNAEKADGSDHVKSKMFWVEECPAAEEPDCGEPGAPACPEEPACGEPGEPACPEEPQCGEPGAPACPEEPECGEPGAPACPEEPEEPGEPSEELECPSDLAAVANDSGSVTLTFTPAQGSEGTNVYRAEGEGDFVYLTTLAANDDSYTDTTVTPETGYAYTVTALFGDEESEDCPVVEVTAIPDFPTLLGMGAATGGGLLAMALLGRRRNA